jgi:hypothetical protein
MPKLKKRKSKPVKIYREEVFNPTYTGSTRQTFDEKQYLNWREHDAEHPLPAPAYRDFYEGTIIWHPTP